MQTVLIIEDHQAFQEMLADHFTSRGVEVWQAFKLWQAKLFLSKVEEIDVIVWDEDLPDGKSSDGLIQEFRNEFSGPMIAASSNHDKRKRQESAGCDHESEPDDLIDSIHQVLDLD